MRVSAIVTAVVLVGMAALTSAQSKTVIWTDAAMKWTDSPAVPGAKVAVLWGDPAKGPYGALKQVPAGAVLARHSHKNDSYVVIVKGSITLDIEGKKHVVTPGSYTMIPGGVPHSAVCGKSTCEYFEHMTGAFDSTPAK